MISNKELLYSAVLEVLANGARQDTEVKSVNIGKEEIKPALFADYMIMYVENMQESTKNS